MRGGCKGPPDKQGLTEGWRMPARNERHRPFSSRQLHRALLASSVAAQCAQQRGAAPTHEGGEVWRLGGVIPGEGLHLALSALAALLGQEAQVAVARGLELQAMEDERSGGEMEAGIMQAKPEPMLPLARPHCRGRHPRACAAALHPACCIAALLHRPDGMPSCGPCGETSCRWCVQRGA